MARSRADDAVEGLCCRAVLVRLDAHGSQFDDEWKNSSCLVSPRYVLVAACVGPSVSFLEGIWTAEIAGLRYLVGTCTESVTRELYENDNLCIYGLDAADTFESTRYILYLRAPWTLYC